MKQGTPEWHQARQKILTASDFGSAANLKGAYVSRQKLWELKTQRDWKDTNAFMEYGQRMEPIARHSFETLSGHLVDDCDLILHPDIDFLGCSPDGLTHSGHLLEIKCPVRAVHTGISEQFLGQIFGQMSCTGREIALFFSYHPEGQRLWRIDWSNEYWAWLFPLLEEFWNYVIKDECPPRKNKQSFDGEIKIEELPLL